MFGFGGGAIGWCGGGGKDMWVVAYGLVGMVIYNNIPSTTNLNINKTGSLLSLSHVVVQVMDGMEMMRGTDNMQQAGRRKAGVGWQTPAE
jgi:hypothetical protein